MSAELTATCRCGQLAVRVSGAPLRVSVCHCHECQRRSGSAFAWQARWPADAVKVAGESKSWQSSGESGGDSGGRATFNFCPYCASTLFYTNDGLPDQIAVAVGGFAGQPQPAPHFSVYENRLQPWLSISGDDLEHM